MKMIKDIQIDFYGDEFFIIGFQYVPDLEYWNDMQIVKVSESYTTKIFTTPGISLN